MFNICKYCKKPYDNKLENCPWCDREVLFSMKCDACGFIIEDEKIVIERDVLSCSSQECPNCGKLVHPVIVPINTPNNQKAQTILKTLFFFLMLFSSIAIFAQKKPTMMILPSDNWCTQRFFTTTFNNQGVKERVPNYQQAFQEDIELRPVIAKVGELMTKNGYNVKDVERELKNISARIAEDNVTMSKTSGAELTESPLDILKKRAKADIVLQIDWTLNRTRSGMSVTFTIEAFDAYTSKRIATASGTSSTSNKEVPLLLEEAVKKQMKTFDKQLSGFYKSMNSNGREIVLTIKVWDSWGNDLETEYDGEELLNHIEDWLKKNTVKKAYNLSDASENFAQFEQVMIPLKDDSGNNLDARGFAKQLQKHLASSPYNITAKLMTRGLGEAILVLGEK